MQWRLIMRDTVLLLFPVQNEFPLSLSVECPHVHSFSGNDKLSSTPKQDAASEMHFSNSTAAPSPSPNPHCRRFRSLHILPAHRSACEPLSANVVFICDVMTGVFDLLTRSLESGQQTINPKLLTESASLFHEFVNCDGFAVFNSLLLRVAAVRFAAHRRSSPNLSPLASPDKTNGHHPHVNPKRSQAACSHDPYVRLHATLLASFHEMVTSFQRSKVEYMHKVTCSRRSHRLCDFQRLVPVHHSILGAEAGLRTRSSDDESRAKTGKFSTFSSSSTKSSKRSELFSFCLILERVLRSIKE